MTSAFSALVDQKLAGFANNANIDRKRSVSRSGDFWEDEVKSMSAQSRRQHTLMYRAFLHGDDAWPSGPMLEISR